MLSAAIVNSSKLYLIISFCGYFPLKRSMDLLYPLRMLFFSNMGFELLNLPRYLRYFPNPEA